MTSINPDQMNEWQRIVYREYKKVNGHIRISQLTETSMAFDGKDFRVPEGLFLARALDHYGILHSVVLNKAGRVSLVFASRSA